MFALIQVASAGSVVHAVTLFVV